MAGMLRAYRKNDYTDAIEGYVIETGLSFIISVDYNKFRQIFLSKKQRMQKREIRKENKQTDKQSDKQPEKQPASVPSQAMLESKENDNETQQ